MIQDYLSITKILFKNSFRRNGANKKKTLLIFLGITAGFLPLVILISVAVYHITPQIIEAEIFREMIIAVISSTQLVVFFFGIFSIIAYMFFSEDAEFLASLPVKKSALFTSKLTMVYINELIISFVILVPILTIMGISAINYGMAINWYYFALIPFAFIFTPLIPLLLVSVLAFPMMYVVSFFRKRALLSSLVLIFLFIGFMMLYLGTIGNMPESSDAIVIGEGVANALNAIAKVLFFNAFFANAMIGFKVILNLFLFLLIVSASMTLTIVISSSLYHKSVMGQLESQSGKAGNGKIDEQKEKSRAFLIKDLKMLIRNPSFAIQSFMGVLLTPLMILFLGRTLGTTMDIDPSEMEGVAFQFNAISITGYILFFAGMLLCGTNFVASVAFTREGKFFYFIKYLPISYKQMIKGKLNFAVYTGLIGVVLTTIVYTIMVDTNLLNALLFGGALALMNYGFSYMGIYRDLRKPKLEWNNVQEAIKQNLNAMFPMLIGSIYGIVLLVLSILIENSLGEAFVSWLILWIVAYIPLIGILIYYKQQLDNNYLKLINNIE